MDIKEFFDAQSSISPLVDVRPAGEEWAIEALSTEDLDDRPLHLLSPEELLLWLEEEEN